MNGQDNEDIYFERYEEIQTQFNVTDLFKALAFLFYGENDKLHLGQILHALESLDVQLAELIKRSGTELTPAVLSFLNARIAEHRTALKKQIFGFFRAGQIEQEAANRAIRDASQFVGLVTLSNDPAFRRILVDRNRLIREIFDELHGLVERGQTVVISPERMAEFLRWIKNKKFLST